MMSDFHKRLRRYREGLHISQSCLAKRCGLSPAAISHFETGARLPSFNNLRKLAVGLGVSADKLLGIKIVNMGGGYRTKTIDEAGSEELLFALLYTNGIHKAPLKTERYGPHSEALVAIGNDHTASITLDDDAVEMLNRRMGQ